jgi:hypothetical protein
VKTFNDPDPEKKKVTNSDEKVTNSDEQEVAVNYSTQENGFDEPDPSSPEKSKDDNQKENQNEKPSTETFKE